MEKFGWNDKIYDIEKMLEQFPVVKDYRKPEDIYRSITPNLKKKRQIAWFFPTVASLGAITVVFIISSSLFLFSAPTSTDKSSESIQEKGKIVEALDTSNDLSNQPNIFSDTLTRYAVQSDQNFITFGLLGAKGGNIIVPISVLTTKKEVPAIQQMNTKNEEIANQDWGLLPAPFNQIKSISVAENNNKEKAIIDLRLKTSLDSSSTGKTFLKSLEESFRYQNIEALEFQTNGKSGAIIAGETKTSVSINDVGHSAFFEYMYDENYPVFLTRSNQQFKTILDAITNMESENFKLKAPLHPPIPGGVDIENVDTNEKTKHVTITFTKDSGLLNNHIFIIMLDSLLLTAREFGYKTVTFTGAENSKIDQIGEIEFNTEIPVPTAPNPVILH
ncbi:hypothetical protein ACQKCU_04935 [Heyndrickxia sporothermodurans]